MTDALLDQLVNEIEAALKAATPGPWVAEDRRTVHPIFATSCKGAIAECHSGTRGFFPSTKQRAANAHLIAHAPEWLQALVGRLRQAEQERDHERENSRAILRKYEGALADADRADAALRKLYDVAFDLWSHEAVGTQPWLVLGRTLAEIKPEAGVGSPTGAPQA